MLESVHGVVYNINNSKIFRVIISIRGISHSFQNVLWRSLPPPLRCSTETKKFEFLVAPERRWRAPIFFVRYGVKHSNGGDFHCAIPLCFACDEFPRKLTI
ncbi:hypothetical protein CEXT_741401 [Caerostris extrusa]|uniref:Uncharacterized protein n=1 Tax=Caerostris extrusa TaxID=172846 RepID=A0AAV4UC62_CAEEX|nr:hypothetical protein CEXT_741401 [Caerostris extrusa]